MSSSVIDVIEHHRSSGLEFEADGVRSFAIDWGEGPPVVCLHGVPSSSFLYRKLVPELAERGFRGVAFDYPGMGLAERPTAFDYSWSGLARWTGTAIDALGIDRCHLVVHDIGGPIGFEWAIRNPTRVLSLTVLNSPVDVAAFRRPFPMHQFSVAGLGELWLALMRPPAARWIFRHVGLSDRKAMSKAEIDAYFTLLKMRDGGRAFLRIMRGFELTQAKQDFFAAGLADRPYPAQVVWGRDDPALGDARREAVQRTLGGGRPVLLPGRHFLQEDHAPAIAASVANLAG